MKRTILMIKVLYIFGIFITSAAFIGFLGSSKVSLGVLEVVMASVATVVAASYMHHFPLDK